ncbi:hypothetical protein SEUCBS140593_010216 [Sporothrix eucalyptigena]|uniref:Uncharacterized protein n=1 Tax=Sporothrix eucalyptigena TaxID=1812306 RepID=A0ABP0D3E5_9PEZI
MLCQPGIVFYQEAQTITVRITRIAHAHRSRGNVEDETEVMAIAATILKDLAALFARRPAIMDTAVGKTSRGNSMMNLLSPSLASVIVRSYNAYLANFYDCYIRLHRVAHRHLVRSQSVLTAVEKIKDMVHAMADGPSNGSSPEGATGNHIMLNLMWAFLWGDECRWIINTIRSLHHLVINANMTVNAL